MAKTPILSDVVNIPTAASTINANSEKIVEAFENTLSLDGSTPNAMNADLDMNSNDIINANSVSTQDLVVNGESIGTLVDAAVDASVSAVESAAAALASETAAALSAAAVVTVANDFPDPKGDWLTATAYGKGDIVTINGGSEICLIAHTSGVFATDKAALKWQTLASQGASGLGTGDMLAAQNLNDVASKPTARTNLGLGSIATQAASAVAITGGTVTGITDLAVADGGTGASDAATARTNLGAQAADADLTAIASQTYVRGDIIRAGASGLERLAKGSAGKVLGYDANDVVAINPPGPVSLALTSTNVAGPFAFDVPAGVGKIELICDRISLDSSGNWFVQIGPAAGYVTSGYESSSNYRNAGVGPSTNGFVIYASSLSRKLTGKITLELLDSTTNTWVSDHTLADISSDIIITGGGRISLAGGLEKVRLNHSGGNTPDGGQFKVRYYMWS